MIFCFMFLLNYLFQTLPLYHQLLLKSSMPYLAKINAVGEVWDSLISSSYCSSILPLIQEETSFLQLKWCSDYCACLCREKSFTLVGWGHCYFHWVWSFSHAIVWRPSCFQQSFLFLNFCLLHFAFWRRSFLFPEVDLVFPSILEASTFPLG